MEGCTRWPPFAELELRLICVSSIEILGTSGVVLGDGDKEASLEGKSDVGGLDAAVT